MSRRIAFCFIAASAALIAAPTQAEICLFGSCRTAAVIEPPPASQQAEPLVDQTRSRPRTTAPRPPAGSAPRRAETLSHRTAVVARDARRGHFIGSRTIEGAPDNVGVQAPNYADDAVVAAYPDPSWKLCQISAPGVALRYYYCGPYSYYPYGVYGYRPFGTYGYAPSAPVYGAMPNARVIDVDRDD